MKKNYIIIILVLICIVGLILFVISGQNAKNKEVEVKKIFTGTDVSSTEKITCTYSQILSSYYIDNEIKHSLPRPETNPLVFTFSELNEAEVGQLSYIDSTQTITNVPIVKIVDDEEKYIFLDGSGENYLSMHTIYKKSGVSLYSKSVDLLGIKSGSMAMGSCVGY